jgi:hypothetical protein
MTSDGIFVIWIRLDRGPVPVMSFDRLDEAQAYLCLHTSGMRARLWIEDVETGKVVTEGR